MNERFYFTAFALGRYEGASNATLNMMFVGLDDLSPEEVAYDFVRSFLKIYKSQLTPYSATCCGTTHEPEENFKY